MTFASLFSPSGETHSLFVEMIQRSHLRLYEEGTLLQPERIHIVLAVVLWSRYDVELLDEINRPWAKSATVHVFNLDEPLQTLENLAAIYPGVRVLQTPVMGVWRNGHFVEAAQGRAAIVRTRELLTQAAGLG